MLDAIHVLFMLLFFWVLCLMVMLVLWLRNATKQYRNYCIAYAILVLLSAVAFAFCVIIYNQQLMMGGAL